RFCPEGVGVRLADDGLGTSPKTGASTGLTHSTRWFTAGARQIAGKPAPTAFGQNQQPKSPQYRFCPEGVGVRLADDGLGTSPKTGASTSLTHRTLWFTAGARQIAGKPAPTA
ncbi:hypothetical protein ABQX22_26695, partial [Xanthomonas sp. WHRI 1810A]|uniref:hypothetical protein n=1 Tax=Xanthomonas sp. WHRI 1810A TaxID=3161565 RepID=UPI0032E91B6A